MFSVTRAHGDQRHTAHALPNLAAMPRKRAPRYASMIVKKNKYENDRHVNEIAQDPYIVCQRNVDENDEAMTCDGCHLWQHRTCGHHHVTAKLYKYAMES